MFLYTEMVKVRGRGNLALCKIENCVLKELRKKILSDLDLKEDSILFGMNKIFLFFIFGFL